MNEKKVSSQKRFADYKNMGRNCNHKIYIV